MNENLIITPKTKIWDIIEAYPQLEETIIQYAPAFSKLKNPLLRRTIGKVATLQQAAATANVNINEFVALLRKEIDQTDINIEMENNQYQFNQPAWFSSEKISEEFDVREMLERGEHPVSKVIDDLKHLKDGGIYKLIVQFLPAPLIDKATTLDYNHWIDKQNDELYHIYFSK